MVSPCTISIMPSESSFKRQAELAQDALKMFTTVRSMKSTPVIMAAITELIDATVGFNNFVPFFVSFPLFQEIPSAVLKALDDFVKVNPDFHMPSGMAKIASLDARARDAAAPPRKGMVIIFPCLLLFFLFLETVSSAPRVDKRSKTTVCPCLHLFIY